MDDFVTIPPIKLSGHVKIETFNDHTGKKVFETEGHNLFTNYGLYEFRSMSKLLIGGQFSANGFCKETSPYMMTLDSQAFGFMKYLVLTDNASAITTSDCAIPGNVTGIAIRNYILSSDVKYGLMNINETILTSQCFKAVFDFATDRANGTHKSVFWADNPPASFDNYYMFDVMNDGVKGLARSYSRIVESNDGLIYGLVGTTLYKINPSTYEEVATYTLPYGPTMLFDVFDGICCYAQNNNTVHIFDLTTRTETTKTVYFSQIGYGCYFNGYIYLQNYNANYSFVKYKLSDWTYELKSQETIAGAKLLRCGQTIYAVYNAKIYLYDYENNVITLFKTIDTTVNGNLNHSNSTGLILQDSWNSYNTGSTSKTIYQLLKLNANKSPANMITGKLLDAPVTKTSDQTMKVTYTISFSE